MEGGLRRATTSSLLAVAVVGGVVAAVVGLVSIMPGITDRRVVRGQVPNVVGLQERDAVKALAQAGLIAEIRIDRRAPMTGEVLRTDPSAGVELGPGSTVLLEASHMPMPPPAPPGVDPEERYTTFGQFVENHHDAIVGYYIDEKGRLIVVFSPGVDIEAWLRRLEPHLGKGNQIYRTETCPRSWGELLRIQNEINPDLFTDPKGIAYSSWPEPATCTVRLTSDLFTREDIRRLIDRFGTAISFETTPGSHPEPA